MQEFEVVDSKVGDAPFLNTLSSNLGSLGQASTAPVTFDVAVGLCFSGF